MNTLKETVDYVYNYIKDYENNQWEIVDQNVLYDMMEEMLLEAVEWTLSDDDMKTRVSNKDDNYFSSDYSSKTYSFNISFAISCRSAG